MLHRAGREKQTLGDLAVGQPAGHEAKHLDLARAEVARPGGAGARQADRGNQRGCALGVEAPGAGLGLELDRRLREVARRAMGALLGQRGEDVGRRQQSLLARQLRSAGAAVVARSVEALVV